VLSCLSQLQYRPPPALPRAVLERFGGQGGGIQDAQQLLVMMLVSMQQASATGFKD
jgi:hypothetical protein